MREKNESVPVGVALLTDISTSYNYGCKHQNGGGGNIL